MVSTKNTNCWFEFDNCLMNAAGVACMTIEELEGVKKLSGRNLCHEDSDLGLSSGKS